MVASSIEIGQLKLDQDPDAGQWLLALREVHPEIYYHCSRVAMLAEKIAIPLGLPEQQTEQLVRGCFLHDIGKTLIPRELITQRNPLTNDQWEELKHHAVIGARMAESNPGFGQEIVDIVRYHHERWDGRGYPEGLSEEKIPLGARICAVIDAFDSMTSNKIYRRRIKLYEARLELIRHAGTQFDPEIVHAMMILPEQTLDIYSL
ncbi:putative nucleotidyltransferase with HDIG domain [Fontibacillus phaseoli]|uniref:Putative nucleotidyltransferase with HDIG domain n=1 Tax=Fontibacillus phaseoli TaxID=1416533 RepID=A0A369BEK6_9BACL|nr:HD domain-containing phosphohydrolase [Fontibacillus phaseoli]RCX18104.1 putative nucleotidyltransferase with HDIG domain [Fontibacillus phaseoli]